MLKKTNKNRLISLDALSFHALIWPPLALKHALTRFGIDSISLISFGTSNQSLHRYFKAFDWRGVSFWMAFVHPAPNFLNRVEIWWSGTPRENLDISFSEPVFNKVCCMGRSPVLHEFPSGVLPYNKSTDDIKSFFNVSLYLYWFISPV